MLYSTEIGYPVYSEYGKKCKAKYNDSTDRIESADLDPFFIKIALIIPINIFLSIR